MKFISTLLAVTFATGVASAQNYITSPVGVVSPTETYSLEGLTPSAIVVEFEVDEVSFKAGEYARYAQKYLGVRAKLMDSKSIVVSSSSLKLAPADYFIAKGCEAVQSGVEVISKGESDPLLELPVDRYSATILPLEEAASAAAAQIFKIRTTRRDLISGDIGEGVFGGGLNGALATFESTERRLVEMFMGRESRKSTKYRYVVTMEQDKMQYVVCRFDKSRGIVPASDLTAEPVYLQITASDRPFNIFKKPGEKETNRAIFKVADMSKCDLFVSGAVVSSEILPLFIFGTETEVAIIKR